MVDQLFEAEHLRAQGRFIGKGTRLNVLSHPAEQGFQAARLPGHSVHNEMAKF
jgi:hypothetical protein